MPENAPAHPPVFDTGCYVGTTVAADIYSEGGAHLATVHPHPQQMSRARLYAAAPDLLAACQAVLARLDLEAAQRAQEGKSPVFLCAAMRDTLRAVIAKATGK